MSDIHHVLLRRGYQFVRTKKLEKSSLLYRALSGGAYIKEYMTGCGEFKVAIHLPNDPHIELPSAYTLKTPRALQGKLTPHISHEGYLCYVEKMEADWDPNNLEGLYEEIDLQIQSTLDTIADCSLNQKLGDIELENEFVSYWSATDSLYMLSEGRRATNYITVLGLPTDEKEVCVREFITIGVDHDKRESYLNNDELNRWLTQRKLYIVPDSKTSIPTHYISVVPQKLAGVDWPPSNMRDFLIWLACVDTGARDRLVHSLSSSKTKRNIVLLDILHQDSIALYLEINQKSYETRSSFKRSAKKRVKPSVRNMITIQSSKHFCSTFNRLSVLKADRTTIQSRNKDRMEDLSSKKIALIGCGTIGGYLAELLIRNGAGGGKKPLHLFDNDEFKPHNFSRHTLTSSSFGKNKASELSRNLGNSIHTAKNVKGFGVSFLVNERSISSYDIIIDATGRPPVSKRLAFVTRQLEADKRPVLIHAFNDGNGRASKVFIDGGNSCYGCLTIDKSVHQELRDIRFDKVALESDRRVSCGNTYTIYDAAVSHITAAIAQEATLNTLEAVVPWTYGEVILDKDIRSGKRKVLAKQKGCSICDR